MPPSDDSGSPGAGPAPETPETERRPATVDVSSAIQFAVLAGLLAAAYWRQLYWMVTVGWRNEYYEHAVFIPLITAVMLYRRREQFLAAPVAPDSRGAILTAAALALHLAAIRADVHFPSIVSFVLVLIGLVWWFYGRPRVRTVLFPLAYLFFMVPLGRVLVEFVGGPAQVLAASLAGLCARLLGLPVAIAGTTVRLPSYEFDVGLQCSGLKSLITLTALAALYAYLVDGRLRQRLAIFATAVPVAILANAGRIALVLLLGQGFSPELADGFFHGASGIVLFAVATIALIAIGRAIGCTQLREDL